jgi:uncharacterized protein
MTMNTCRPLRPLAVATLLALVAANAGAASFDCTKAASRIEKLICADAELSRLDSELGQLYDDARRAAGTDLATLKRAQRAWLKQREDCGDSDCVARAYRQRIAELGGDAEVTDGGSGEGSAAEAAMGEPKTQRTAKEVKITQSGPKFNVEVAYPRLGSDKAAAAGERVLEGVVDEQLGQFRDYYRELLADGGHVGPPWELVIGYDAPFTAARFWAIGLSGYTYTGGAHGGEQHLPVVIDRETGKGVPPAGLFRTGSPWLKTLSDYSYQALAGREPFTPDDDWLRRGSAAQAGNYRALLPQADGLHVIFEQYQVGPYAIGSHEVTVPYDALSGLLNPTLFPDGRP